jgi:glycine/D-amino acid oxidase-like deaminating enzyme
MEAEHYETIVIGGGQAGLTAGYYLAREGREFLILEANDSRRRMAQPVGLAAAVHAGEVQPAAGHADSGHVGLVLRDEGRDGRLP